MKRSAWFFGASLIAVAGLAIGSSLAQQAGGIELAQAGQNSQPTSSQPTAPPATQPTTPPTRTRPKPGERVRPAPGTNPATDPNAPPKVSPNGPGVLNTASEPALTTLRMASDPGPYLQREMERSRQWTFNVRVEVEGSTYDQMVSDPRGGSSRMPGHDTWDFKTLAVVFPLLKSTASSDVVPNSWEGVLRVNDKVADEKIESGDLIEGNSGSRMVKFTAVDGTARQVDLNLTYKMVSYNTKLDEAAAMKVGWPKGGWPADAASTFKPQMFVDYAPDPQTGGDLKPFDTEPLQNLLNSWLRAERVSSPHDVPPVMLAKIITGGVVKDFQPTGNGVSYNRRGQLEGIAVTPIPTTILEGKGSEFDITCVLVAAMRQAGLPARMVFGWQKEEKGGDDKFLDKSKGVARLRAWAEFALFDENFKPDQACMNWIPVDVVALRKTSSRPPPLNRNWRYFGTIDDLAGTAPFSFHLHPPTTVRAYGSPGFWGWWMTPQNPPHAMQNLLFNVTRTAVRAEDRTNDNDRRNQPRRR